ncbi:hypothetical protein J6590_028643 [Homalodisca vitripennis]|nr:hypothetical protein J6590_028643 [Homalodisca vitripennis]
MVLARWTVARIILRWWCSHHNNLDFVFTFDYHPGLLWCDGLISHWYCCRTSLSALICESAGGGAVTTTILTLSSPSITTLASCGVTGLSHTGTAVEILTLSSPSITTLASCGVTGLSHTGTAVEHRYLPLFASRPVVVQSPQQS